MDQQKKTYRPKKPSKAEADASYALSSAVVRGSSQEVLAELRAKLAQVKGEK